MVLREEITDFIKSTGPVLPIQVAKKFNSNTIIISAHLSELVSRKELKVSSVKVGGSPVYYLPTQGDALQNFSSYLHEKERRAYDIIKAKKVLRNDMLEPLIRVALQNIKDFAIPLQVNYDDKTEVFWKWYLTPQSETEDLIKLELTPKTEEKTTQQVEQGTNTQQTPIQEQPQTQIIEEQPTNIKSIDQKPKEPEPIIKKAETKQPKTNTTTSIDFLDNVMGYFNKKKIEVIEKNIIRKNSEAEYIIKLPTSVGALTYYCKVKSKKRINDGDLSSAFMTGQSKKLPTLFLSQGDLTKRAKEMLDVEFKGMGVMKL